jgi:GNAT superfamily N-acetyltransferase
MIATRAVPAGAVPGGAVPTAAAPAGAVPAGLVAVRQATTADRDALDEMFDRCTPQTRYRRFHGAVSTLPRRYLTEALSGSPVHHALVAFASGTPGSMPYGTEHNSPDDASRPIVVALASCRVIDEGMAEVGILVEDAWQRHGVGAVLLAELVAHARALGLRALTAQLLAEQSWTAGMLARHGSCRAGRASRGVVTVTLRLSSSQTDQASHADLAGWTGHAEQTGYAGQVS